MQHFVTVAFWTLMISASLHARNIPKDSKVSYMQKHVKCNNNSVFYTPTEVTTNCITSALDCVKKEFAVVLLECDDPKKFVNQSVENLEWIINNRTGDGYALNSNECPCEQWPQTPFQEFLVKLKDLLEQEND